MDKHPEVSVLTGESGTGKSFLTNTIALKYMAKGTVLFVVYDETPALVRHRIRTLLRAQGVKKKKIHSLLDNVHILYLSDPLYGTPDDVSYEVPPVTLPGWDNLLAAVSLDPLLVVLDSFECVFYGQYMRAFVRSFTRLLRTLERPVLLVAGPGTHVEHLGADSVYRLSRNPHFLFLDHSRYSPPRQRPLRILGIDEGEFSGFAWDGEWMGAEEAARIAEAVRRKDMEAFAYASVSNLQSRARQNVSKGNNTLVKPDEWEAIEILRDKFQNKTLQNGNAV